MPNPDPSFADQIEFADESDTPKLGGTDAWKILIVDDEPEIHAITELALRNFEFSGAPLSFLHAYTGADSVAIMRREQDVAIVLMDVVMESDNAGLEAVESIRNELNNWTTRIVLRTGQPGQAPEREVVTRYDINDYKEKTELTANKLFTLVYTGLSLYREIRSLRQTHTDIRSLVDAAREIFQERDPRRLATGLLKQLHAMYAAIGDNWGASLDSVVVAAIDTPLPVVLAGTGAYAASVGKPFQHAGWLAAMRQMAPDSVATQGHALLGRCRGNSEQQTVVILESDKKLTHPNDEMLEMFFGNISAAFANSFLAQEVDRNQHEMVLMLSEAIEVRSLETGNHVRRVGEYCAMLAAAAGLSDDDVSTLRVAAPLHDAGKIAIPDAILHKPGKHTPDEWAVMQTHAAVGEKMLLVNDRPILRAAAIVAGQHHERWDGMGYPNKLSGEEIHIYGRIAAIADVFDALCSARCYKDPWPIEDVLELLRAERGRQFDPRLIDLFLQELDTVLEIQQTFTD